MGAQFAGSPRAGRAGGEANPRLHPMYPRGQSAESRLGLNLRLNHQGTLLRQGFGGQAKDTSSEQGVQFLRRARDEGALAADDDRALHQFGVL